MAGAHTSVEYCTLNCAGHTCTTLTAFRQHCPVLVWSASVLDTPVTPGQVWVSACPRALHPQHTADAGEMNLTCSGHSGQGLGSCRQQTLEGPGCGITPGDPGAGMLFALRMRNKPEGKNTALVAAGAAVHTQAASRQSSKGDGNQPKIWAFERRRCVTAQILALRFCARQKPNLSHILSSSSEEGRGKRA